MSNLPTKLIPGALDLLGVDVFEVSSIPDQLRDVETDRLIQGMKESANTVKAQTEVWKQQVGLALWELARRLDRRSYGQIVTELEEVTGFSDRTLRNWKERADSLFGLSEPAELGEPEDTEDPDNEDETENVSANGAPPEHISADEIKVEGAEDEGEPDDEPPVTNRTKRQRSSSSSNGNGKGRLRPEVAAVLIEDEDVLKADRADWLHTAREVEGWARWAIGLLDPPVSATAPLEREANPIWKPKKAGRR